MGHIGSDDLKAAAPRQAGGGEVGRLIEAEPPLQPQGAQPAQVAHRAFGGHGEGEEGGVGRHHQLLVQPPLQTQGLNAVGLVLISHPRVKGEKSRFRDPPGGVGPGPPALLGIDAEGQRLVHQGVLLTGQQQIGHEIFKHGPGPGGHAAVIVVPQQHPAQPAPVPGRDLSPGHGHVAGLPGLAGHQVIVAGGGTVPLRLPADEKQPAVGVVQG